MKRKEAEHLLQVSLDSEKNERKRIAEDLHDSVAGDLSAIKNYLVLLQKTDKSIKNLPVFEELKIGVENALENTRLISYKLMPPLLESFGLIAAVKDNFERLEQKSFVKFTMLPGSICNIPATISYELFRVIQELTTNMLKYGEVTKCNIAFKESADIIFIDIIDDGVPYDFFELLKVSKGAGLKNICSRLKVIDANITQQKISSGNHFTVTLKKHICLK